MVSGFTLGWITHALKDKREVEERFIAPAFDIALGDVAETAGGLVASGSISLEVASVTLLKASQATGFIAQLGLPAVKRLTVGGLRIGLERPQDFWGYRDV
jgi:hypothetical protein